MKADNDAIEKLESAARKLRRASNAFSTPFWRCPTNMAEPPLSNQEAAFKDAAEALENLASALKGISAGE